MRLDAEGLPEHDVLVPPNWRLEWSRESSMFVAIVLRDGQPACRLSLSAGERTEEQARRELTDKARRWVAEMIERESSGAGGP